MYGSVAFRSVCWSAAVIKPSTTRCGKFISFSVQGHIVCGFTRQTMHNPRPYLVQCLYFLHAFGAREHQLFNITSYLGLAQGFLRTLRGKSAFCFAFVGWGTIGVIIVICVAHFRKCQHLCDEIGAPISNNEKNNMKKLIPKALTRAFTTQALHSISFRSRCFEAARYPSYLWNFGIVSARSVIKNITWYNEYHCKTSQQKNFCHSNTLILLCNA